MKPRRTHNSNAVYELEGGNEDSALWCERTSVPDTDWPLVKSVWEPSAEERQAIAAGANIEVAVWGGQPPVSMGDHDGGAGQGAAGRCRRRDVSPQAIAQSACA